MSIFLENLINEFVCFFGLHKYTVKGKESAAEALKVINNGCREDRKNAIGDCSNGVFYCL